MGDLNMSNGSVSNHIEEMNGHVRQLTNHMDTLMGVLKPRAESFSGSAKEAWSGVQTKHNEFHANATNEYHNAATALGRMQDEINVADRTSAGYFH